MTQHTRVKIVALINGKIEAHFRFVKQDLLRERSRLRPSKFVTKYLMDIRGRINDRKMPHIGKSKKGKRELLSVEEKWRKQRNESKYTDRNKAIKH